MSRGPSGGGGVVAHSAAGWEAQYEKDFLAQRSSGPVVFTEDQRRKNRELCTRLRDLLPFDDAYKVSDCDLMYRFLIGKHWNLAATEKGMREYVQLRKSDRLDSIIAEHLHPTICSVLSPLNAGMPCPIYGLDKEGLPVLWLAPDAAKLVIAMKDFTNEQLLRGQLRSMELGRYICLERKVERCTYVIDLGGITMSSVNKVTLALLKGVMNLLQIAYPEIMRRLLIFNTGWAVSAAWKVLRPLVDVRVQDKIKFESGPPTLAALQQYMAADQVHPAFGGTGKINVLDHMIDAEMKRIQGRLETSASSEAVVIPAARAASLESGQNTSAQDPDSLTLYSIYSTSQPATTAPSPTNNNVNSGTPDAHHHHHHHANERERVVIGVPSAMAAWLDRTNEFHPPKNVLDMSLSIASSSADYPCDKEDAAAPVGASSSAPRTPSSDAAAAAAPPHESEPCGSAGVSAAPALPSVAISLTYGADGSVTGFCGRQWVGRFRQGRLYAPTMDSGDDESRASRQRSPPGPAPTRRGSGRSVGVPAGELLNEAGHPLHNFLIVCDAQRRARYLVRESRLRTRLTIFNVIGDATVHTQKSNRHYVEGERAKLGVVVAHANAAGCGGKGAWMLYGEDVTRRPARNPILPLQQLFSKTKRAVSAAEKSEAGSDCRGAATVDKTQSGFWPASVLAALRPSPRATHGGGDAPSSPTAAAAASRTARDRKSESDDGTLLLAECKRQTVTFYNLLTKNSLSDLFALAVAITQSWSGESARSKSTAATSKGSAEYSEDDVMA
ncbi:CRAL/TRIO domain containing protein [Novymonas esmeraldas]|uniref:CRAL/TRIO domain containing protein n=1 Tax=Novymonas esmeraldas TaxID=1808958 RepID=A0AAW0EXQ9_9TRYP